METICWNPQCWRCNHRPNQEHDWIRSVRCLDPRIGRYGSHFWPVMEQTGRRRTEEIRSWPGSNRENLGHQSRKRTRYTGHQTVDRKCWKQLGLFKERRGCMRYSFRNHTWWIGFDIGGRCTRGYPSHRPVPWKIRTGHIKIQRWRFRRSIRCFRRRQHC